MELNQNITNLEECINAYKSIQTQHLSIMKSESLPDIERMTQERASSFQLLKTSLDSFMENSGSQFGTDSLPLLSKYEDRLATIMKLDEAITIEIKKHRNGLKNNLNRVKKGKEAMSGYKNAVPKSQNPCVLSMNR